METEREFKVRVANNILNARKAKGWGRPKLIKIVETSEWHLFNIEKGVCAPNILTLKRIADALEMDIKDLL